MQIARTIEAMRLICKQLRLERGVSATLGLVPTMGALHAGHVSLVRAAKRECELVAASIFLNPMQFGPNEDLAKYPRTFQADCEKLQAEGVDVLFAPDAKELYPKGLRTVVEVLGISDRLDGKRRVGHFRGVATVVAKLFGIIGPDRAYFGQKDAAQVAVLRAMIEDLNLPVEMQVVETVRDPDGLAMSSRNVYLSAEERARALAIPRSLEAVRGRSWTSGGEVEAWLRDTLNAAPGLELEYAEAVHPDTLEPAVELAEGALVAVAAKVGTTRLIDNVLLPPHVRRATEEAGR